MYGRGGRGGLVKCEGMRSSGVLWGDEGGNGEKNVMKMIGEDKLELIVKMGKKESKGEVRKG